MEHVPTFPVVRPEAVAMVSLPHLLEEEQAAKRPAGSEEDEEDPAAKTYQLLGCSIPTN